MEQFRALYKLARARYRRGGVWALLVWFAGFVGFNLLAHLIWTLILHSLFSSPGPLVTLAVQVGVIAIPAIGFLMIQVWLVLKYFGPDSDVRALQKAFELSHWPDARLCRDLLLLPLYSTLKEQTGALDRLLRQLNSAVVANSVNRLSGSPVLPFAQETLSRLCDGARESSLPRPGTHYEVETKALECYAALVPCLNDAQMARAIADCRLWLPIQIEIENRARETLRILFPALLDKNLEKEELLDVFERVLRSQSWDLVKIAVSTVASSRLNSPNKARMLVAGFRSSVARWDTIYLVWRTALDWSLQHNHLDAIGRKALEVHIGEYIRSQKPDILTDELNRDYPMHYTMLCMVMATLRNQPNGTRPKARHIVSGDPGLDAEITLESRQVLNGKIGNFSVGDSIWNAGAWMTSVAEVAVPTGGIAGTIRIRDQAIPDMEAIVPNIRIMFHTGETPNNNAFWHQHGYRVMFGKAESIPESERPKLARLCQRYPVTQ